MDEQNFDYGEDLSQDGDGLTPSAEEKVLVILKSQPDGMKAAEIFLRNRGWNVISTDKLREALAFLIQKQPKYLMIAADHPHKKVKVLPKILSQAFVISVIAYVEKSTRLAMRSIQEMGMNYNLFPPVSGPAVERMILRIRKDEMTVAEEQSKMRLDPNYDSTQDRDSQSAQVFKGQDGKLITLQGHDSGESADAARSALAALLNDPDVVNATGAVEDSDQESTFAQGGGGTDSGGGFSQSQGSSGSGFINQQSSSGQGPSGSFFAKGGGQGPAGPAYKPGAPGEKNPFLGGSGAGSGNAGFAYNPQTGKNEPIPGYQGGQGAAGENPLMGNGPGAQGGPGFMNPGTPGADGQIPFNSGQQGPLGTPGSFGGQEGDSQNSQGTGPSQSAQEKARAQIAKSAIVIKGDPSDNHSLFEVGVQQSLNESIDALGEKKVIAGESRRVICVTVESNRFNGYLVAAMGQNRSLDAEFMEGVKKRLFNFLKSNGENVSEAEGAMELKIAEVPFQDWSMECANFLVKTVHGNDEIAMAFFPSETTKVDLEQSVSEKMLQIDLTELREDTVMEFDLYIYMPENQRYLLYTPTGRPLLGDQKSRLVKKGVTHMHLRKENVIGVKKYRAQNFLNDKITEFRALQAQKKA